MAVETAHDYHLRRARAELDWAYRASSIAVVEAHLRLSALHMRKLRDGQAIAAPSSAELRATREARIPA